MSEPDRSPFLARPDPRSALSPDLSNLADIANHKTEAHVDLDNLSPQQTAALDELVHDQASQVASDVINNGQGIDWLLANGWTLQDIRDRVNELVTSSEPT